MSVATPSPFPTTEQKQEARRAKRDAVLLAAVRMFNERGFHATSLDDVAASIGISKPTIYHYLGTKDQVLLECVTIGLNQLLSAAEEAQAQSGNGLGRLRQFLENYARINMEDFGRCVIRTGEELLSLESAKQFRSLKREIDHKLRLMIRNAAADQSIAPVDEKIAALALSGALNWPARWFKQDGDMSAAEISNALVEFLCLGLKCRGVD